MKKLRNAIDNIWWWEPIWRITGERNWEELWYRIKKGFANKNPSLIDKKCVHCAHYKWLEATHPKAGWCTLHQGYVGNHWRCPLLEEKNDKHD